MNKISRMDLERMIKDININEFTHILICLNRLDGTCFLRFISTSENIEEVTKNMENQGIYGMLSIEEIYDYHLDREKILDSSNCQSSKKNSDDKIHKALEYATLMHKGQYRNDGTEYINHPIRVAQYVKQFKISTNLETLIICGLLHDTIEDTPATYYDIVKLFGPQVASIVLELTTDEDLKNEIGKTKYLQIKMKNMSSWALVIKLCDRLDNVSDLMNSTELFRNKYLKETIEIIKCLLDNRKLSITHIRIIKCIIERLILVMSVCKSEEYHQQIIEISTKVNAIHKKSLLPTQKK